MSCMIVCTPCTPRTVSQCTSLSPTLNGQPALVLGTRPVQPCIIGLSHSPHHTKTLHPPPQCAWLLNLSSANTSSLRYILFFHPSGCPYRPFGVLLFTVVAVRCKRPIRFPLSTLPTSAAFGQIIHTVESRSSGGLYIHDSIANIFINIFFHLFSI